MGFVGDLVSGASNMLGLGGNQGRNFTASSVPVLQPTDVNQVQNAYGYAQHGLGQQQEFLNALQGMNGIQNQQNVFNQQQGLANQLQGIAQGTGPNPALAQLANTTGQNMAGQAALMAGQRGAGANVGLLARQIGQQGAGIQQQAAGQAAALAAQQQLAGIGALQNQQGMMQNLAGTQVGQQAGALNSYNQAAQGLQSNLLNALGNYNQTRVGQQGNINSANAGIQGINAQGQQKLLGGTLGGIGSALPHIGSAIGSVFGLSDGGMVPSNVPQSSVGNYLKGLSNGGAIVPGDSVKNDQVPAMLSPKEIVLPRSVTMSPNAPENAKKFVEAILARQGGGK